MEYTIRVPCVVTEGPREVERGGRGQEEKANILVTEFGCDLGILIIISSVLRYRFIQP